MNEVSGFDRPFRRNCRQFTDGSYVNSGKWMYIIDSRYAKSPEQYVRAFLLIQKDLLALFDYVEPSDINLKCYSFRIHELLLRACIEIEANFKGILFENGYEKKDKDGRDQRQNMNDYRKIEKTHMLSAYQVRVPYWYGELSLRTPFASWVGANGLNWYQAYNETKHNRHEGFDHANFENLIDAVSGLLVLLSSQFYTQEFSPGEVLIAAEGYGPNDGMESAIGGYFRIKFPDWPEHERYTFDFQEWQRMKNETDPFRSLNYS